MKYDTQGHISCQSYVDPFNFKVSLMPKRMNKFQISTTNISGFKSLALEKKRYEKSASGVHILLTVQNPYLSTVIATILYVEETENVQTKNLDCQSMHSKDPRNPLLLVTLSSLLNKAAKSDTADTMKSKILCKNYQNLCEKYRVQKERLHNHRQKEFYVIGKQNNQMLKC